MIKVQNSSDDDFHMITRFPSEWFFNEYGIKTNHSGNFTAISPDDLLKYVHELEEAATILKQQMNEL